MDATPPSLTLPYRSTVSCLTQAKYEVSYFIAAGPMEHIRHIVLDLHVICNLFSPSAPSKLQIIMLK